MRTAGRVLAYFALPVTRSAIAGTQGCAPNCAQQRGLASGQRCVGHVSVTGGVPLAATYSLVTTSLTGQSHVYEGQLHRLFSIACALLTRRWRRCRRKDDKRIHGMSAYLHGIGRADGRSEAGQSQSRCALLCQRHQWAPRTQVCYSSGSSCFDLLHAGGLAVVRSLRGEQSFESSCSEACADAQ